MTDNGELRPRPEIVEETTPRWRWLCFGGVAWTDGGRAQVAVVSGSRGLAGEAALTLPLACGVCSRRIISMIFLRGSIGKLSETNDF
jgi:hypothetical protein